MNLLELREKIDIEIKNGFGHIPVITSDCDGGYEECTDLEFDDLESGYVIF